MEILASSQITIPIAQFVKNANQSKSIRIFYQIADFLLLIHFTMDPYIYVLLRTNYWIRFKSFMSQLLFKKDHEFAEIPKMDQWTSFSNICNRMETSGLKNGNYKCSKPNWMLISRWTNVNNNLFLLNKHSTMHRNIFNVFFLSTQSRSRSEKGN